MDNCTIIAYFVVAIVLFLFVIQICGHEKEKFEFGEIGKAVVGGIKKLGSSIGDVFRGGKGIETDLPKLDIGDIGGDLDKDVFGSMARQRGAKSEGDLSDLYSKIHKPGTAEHEQYHELKTIKMKGNIPEKEQMVDIGVKKIPMSQFKKLDPKSPEYVHGIMSLTA